MREAINTKIIKYLQSIKLTQQEMIQSVEETQTDGAGKASIYTYAAAAARRAGRGD